LGRRSAAEAEDVLLPALISVLVSLPLVSLEALRREVADVVDRLLDGIGDRTRLDLVDEVAYPLPVSIICSLLGIPPQDEARFHHWADTPARARHPGDDLISGLLTGGTDTEPMSGDELVITTRLLLIAGHETTVNLITNGMLTLLRHPETLQRFREHPDLVVPMVEELVRYEPSVQFRYRAALADIRLGDTTIPRGSTVVLLLAAGSRDPGHFTDPDRFIPDRTPNEHFGFGGGIQYCIGAPLARMEAHVVLPELVRRLGNPRPVADPPPYRPTAALRGPRHPWLDVGGIR
jgi:cytochrome P450